MIIWFGLFAVILIGSFILAVLSMKDYQDTPVRLSDFGVFLIQAPHEFNASILKSLYSDVEKNKEVITLERLFKGTKSALTITGSGRHLQKYSPNLSLLELEDFTKVDENSVAAWEVGVKEGVMRPIVIEDIFKDMPELEVNEQFWWQLTLQATREGNFQCQIRAVFSSPDENRRQILPQKLENINPEGKLVKLPRAFTPAQILKNYKLRAIVPVDKYLLNITPEEVLQLLGKSN